MIAFDCECGEPLVAAPEHAGRRVTCPRCGSSLPVPPPPPSDPLPPPAKRAEPKPGVKSEPDPIRRLMDKAHAELSEDEAKRARERRLVVFTPGIVGGLTLFVVCTLLAVGSILLYNLYLAISLLVFAVLGLFRAVLAFVGQGVD